jgi:tight adherence protein B
VRGGGRAGPAADATAAADLLLRLAVLLRAGVAPARAWAHLAQGGDDIARLVHAAIAEGGDVGEVLAARGGAWREVAAAWTIAATVGAPLADTLADTAEALRDAQRTSDEIRVALAEPAATAKLMGWLPLAAVGLGVVLGFDTMGVLAGSPLGVACVVAGGGLMFTARRWSAALVRRARPPGGVPGATAELTAVALGGGVSLDRAQTLVSEVFPAADDTETRGILDLSRSAGVPAVQLLRSSAWLARHRARTDGRLRAARLATRLLLPLGVCTLPAFLLLGVAPMLLSILSSGVLTL